MPLLNDPIGDLITRMRNAQHARRDECRAPWSSIKMQLLEVFKKEGYIQDVRIEGDAPKQEVVVVFVPGKALTLKRVSTPGRRMYQGTTELKPVLQGLGIAVLTTSQGLMTDKDAKAKHIGGEVLCTIY